jgi:hypothetical protein
LAARNLVHRRFSEYVARDYRLEENSLRKYGGYRISIDGAEHSNFTEPPPSLSLRYQLRDVGWINPVRALRIVNAYTLAFFEKHLNLSREPLLDGPSPEYPEVRFIYQPPPAARIPHQ